MKIDFPLDIKIFDTVTELAIGLNAHLLANPGGYFLITGSSKSACYADRLLEKVNIKPSQKLAIGNATLSDVHAVERRLRPEMPSLIVAVGGGKVGDFGKRLAYLTNIALLIVPTIIANDGLISPVSVLQDGGHSVSLPGRMPDNVLIDMQVLGDAPVRYIRSAACDLITNLSATNDWERSTGGNDVRSHHLAFQVSRMAAHMVLNSRELTIESANFLKAVIYGQMLSGIAMAIAGSSLPCSGSEHLIAHALDAKLLGLDILHGEKVGITSRFCLHLQGFKDSRIEDFFAAFEVSRVFPGCIGFSDQEMAEIFALARKMRPGRATILDTFTDVELAKRYATFIGSERGDDA